MQKKELISASERERQKQLARNYHSGNLEIGLCECGRYYKHNKYPRRECNACFAKLPYHVSQPYLKKNNKMSTHLHKHGETYRRAKAERDSLLILIREQSREYGNWERIPEIAQLHSGKLFKRCCLRCDFNFVTNNKFNRICVGCKNSEGYANHETDYRLNVISMGL